MLRDGFRLSQALFDAAAEIETSSIFTQENLPQGFTLIIIINLLYHSSTYVDSKSDRNW